MFKVVLALFTIAHLSFSQEKISNKDLRNLNKILGISFSGKNIEFSRSSADQYFLNTSDKKKYVKKKLGNSQFKNFDQDFVKNFIDLKYMMEPAPKKCKVSYELFMRGESLKVCNVEKVKIKRVKLLISKIEDIK